MSPEGEPRSEETILTPEEKRKLLLAAFDQDF